jgi:polyhydroxyalkanoate synthesis regulator phasin
MSEQDRPTSWRELMLKTIELGLGALTLTKEAGQRLITELEEKGQMSRQEAAEAFERIRAAGKEQSHRLEEMVNKMVDHALEKTDVARGAEVKALQERIKVLEAALGKSEPSMDDSEHHEASCD